MTSQLPFKTEWAYYGDSPESVQIKACKGLINTLFQWKESVSDASGNKYEPKKYEDSLLNALSILIAHREITPEQLEGILKQLGVSK